MKRIVCIMLAISICLGLAGAALADGGSTPFFQCAAWDPDEVDVSGVREENGRLTGVVKLPALTAYGQPTAELRVDCPVPEDFTGEQRSILHVTRKKITKQDLLDTIGVVAAKPEEGELWQFNRLPETVVFYSSERDIDGYFYREQLEDASKSSDPTYEAEYEQAKRLTGEIIAGFGASAAQSALHANRRDAAHNLPYLSLTTPRAEEYNQSFTENFNEEEAKRGRTKREFTMVRGLYELYGLPVMDQFYYMSDGDWIGAGSEFTAAVRDDGEICHMQISGLPQVVSAEPAGLPAFDWRELLRFAVARLCISNAVGVDEQCESGVIPAAYEVLTELKPCWVGNTADTLIPGWYCVTEERVLEDGSLRAVWSQYGDAATLMKD